MSFCENCGKPLGSGARYCGGCGASVPEDEGKTESIEANTSSEPTAWSCSSCGAENLGEGRFCSRCGTSREAPPASASRAEDAPTAALVGAASPQGSLNAAIALADEASIDTDGESGDRSRPWVSRAIHTPWVLALIAVVVIMAVAAGVLATVVHGSNSQKGQRASAAFDSQSRAIVTVLAPMTTSVAAHLPASLAACKWSTTLGPAVTSAKRLQTALAKSQSDCAALSSQNASQAATKQAISAALRALAAYAGAAVTLPPRLSAVTPVEAQALQDAASAAQAASKHMNLFAPGFQSLNSGTCTIMLVGARKAHSDAALRAFLVRIQNDILDQSQYGRSDIVRAVGGVRGMTMNPDDAATMIESVQSNRQSLLDQLSAMSVPDDTHAAKVFNLLQQSLQHSIEADRYFAAWMHKVYKYYYEWPQGYLGNVPFDSNYDSAVAQSSMASATKGRFCGVYNPIAHRLGLRATWQARQL